MTKENLTKTEAIEKIISLAKSLDIKDNINWTALNVTEDDVYEMMADNVLDQMYSLPEDHRESVSMATITKLLVENFILKIKLEEEKAKHAPSTNRS
jgi:hypothetical protein